MWWLELSGCGFRDRGDILWGTREAHLERSVGIYSRARSVFNLGDSSPMGILGVSFETVTHCLIRFYFSYTPSKECLRQLNSMTVGFHFVTIDSRFTVWFYCVCLGFSYVMGTLGVFLETATHF